MCTQDITICSRNHATARRTLGCTSDLYAIVRHVENGTRMYKIDLDGYSPVLSSLLVACCVLARYLWSPLHAIFILPTSASKALPPFPNRLALSSFPQQYLGSFIVRD